MAILHDVSAGRERLPVAALQRNATVAGVGDVAAKHAVAESAAHTHAVVADEPERAAADAIARAAFDLDGVAARGFENKALKGHV